MFNFDFLCEDGFCRDVIPESIGNYPKGQIFIFKPKNSKSENYQLMHQGKSHAFPGVYYYLSQEEDGRPKWYAGQAIHLGSRAGNSKRISDKSIVILIRLLPKDEEDDLKMDENWRQHLEHLMINDLQKRIETHHIIVENSKEERESQCLKDERNRIEMFFNQIVNYLETKNLPGFGDSIDWSKLDDPSFPYVLGSERTVYQVAKDQGLKYEKSGRVKIFKGARASPSMWSVNVEVQEYKSNLILKEVLVPKFDKKNKLKHYVFEKDHMFMSTSWATRVIKNANQGWDTAGWKKIPQE